MTTNIPTNPINDQVDPLNSGLPELTNIPTSTIPETTLPAVDIPIAVEPVTVVPLPVEPTTVNPITPVIPITPTTPTTPTTPVTTIPSIEGLATSNIGLPEEKIPEEIKPVVPIITTGPSLEKPTELPGQSLDLSPGLTQKTLPDTNVQPVVKTLDQLKTSLSTQPVVENKRKVKDILLIVGILIVGIVALVFGIYIASNAA